MSPSSRKIRRIRFKLKTNPRLLKRRPARESTDRYTSYSYSSSYNVNYYLTPFTGKAVRKSLKAEKRSKESDEESQKTKETDCRYFASAGTFLLLGVASVYYTISRYELPREWHWKASGPENISIWNRSTSSNLYRTLGGCIRPMIFLGRGI